jgi:hypothetical protein
MISSAASPRQTHAYNNTDNTDSGSGEKPA